MIRVYNNLGSMSISFPHSESMYNSWYFLFWGWIVLFSLATFYGCICLGMCLSIYILRKYASNYYIWCIWCNSVCFITISTFNRGASLNDLFSSSNDFVAHLPIQMAFSLLINFLGCSSSINIFYKSALVVT